VTHIFLTVATFVIVTLQKKIHTNFEVMNGLKNSVVYLLNLK